MALQIAIAVVTACRLTGEDPVACARAVYGIRARYVALAALALALPQCRRASMALGVGFCDGTSSIGNARQRPWWNEDHVDEVVGALVAGLYGEQSL